MAAADAVSVVAAMFPQWPRDVVAQVLDAYQGDMTQTCNYLLGASEAAAAEAAAFGGGGAEHGRGIDVAQMVANLKEIVVPALQTQLSGLELPEVSGATERMSYTLSGIRARSVRIPIENVETEFVNEDHTIRIHASHIDVSISIDRWSYERGRLLRDSGSASASFADITAAIVLNVDETDGSVSIGECKCSIEGAVNIHTDESRISWVYNILTVVLRTPLKNALQLALTNAVRDNLEVQVREWTQWQTGH